MHLPSALFITWWWRDAWCHYSHLRNADWRIRVSLTVLDKKTNKKGRKLVITLAWRLSCWSTVTLPLRYSATSPPMQCQPSCLLIVYCSIASTLGRPYFFSGGNMGDTLHQDLIACLSDLLHSIVPLYITPHIDVCLFATIIFTSAINQLSRLIINQKNTLPRYRLKGGDNISNATILAQKPVSYSWTRHINI